MRFEVEATGSDPTVKRVNILPSHSDGIFRYWDSDNDVRMAGKIGLAGLSKDNVEWLEQGTLDIEDLFTFGGDSLTFMPTDGTFVLVAEVRQSRSAASQPVGVKQFQEMQPVPLRPNEP